MDKPKKKKRSKKRVKIIKAGLNFLCDDKWFKDPENSTFWLRLYTCINIPWKVYLRISQKAFKKLNYDRSVKISHVILDGLDIQKPEMQLFSTKFGIPQINIHAEPKKLPKTSYIVFSTPCKIDGHQENEAAIKNRLDILSSVLNMHFGNNYLRDLKFDAVVNAHDSKAHFIGDVFQIPQHEEGPLIHPINWKDSKDIIMRLKKLPLAKKKPIELALALFEKGIRDRTGTKFFYYWSALEVLCDGAKTIKLTDKLAH